ncbi:MAG TPA: acyl-CoA dehydrogenase family protein [Acidimicrobiales bacterium]|nr:acyl-CoA dehydrogenase family protein [Acidimicrobiales bacterium]
MSTDLGTEPAPGGVAEDEDVEAFAARARAWLAEQKPTVPHDWGPIMPPERREEGMAWQRRLYDAGFAAIHWPAAYGGRGLSIAHTQAWTLACAHAQVPSVLNMVGLVLAGGSILLYGTEAQKREHLPRTARGDVVWCQLFSEPGAGSDLASLSTRAERDGDVYVVNGQKVWCSGGRASDWGILMARTDPDAPKHKGISFFLVDMSTPGIECRPLRQMTGGAEFDEVFLTDVRIPAANLLGPENEGWRVGMTTLTNERGHIGAGTVALERRVDNLVAEAKQAGDIHPAQRDRLVRNLIQAKVLLAMSRRQGPQASVASSLLKVAVAELTVELADARADRAGMAATLADHPAAQGLVAAPGAKLGGGTGEVQRNIIGEMILGLPKEPRPT